MCTANLRSVTNVYSLVTKQVDINKIKFALIIPDTQVHHNLFSQYLKLNETVQYICTKTLVCHRKLLRWYWLPWKHNGDASVRIVSFSGFPNILSGWGGLFTPTYFCHTYFDREVAIPLSPIPYYGLFLCDILAEVFPE